MDLKFQNIFVNFDPATKKIQDLCIADFGFSQTFEEVSNLSHILGTIPVIPPEMIREQRVDEKADSWALGVILYMILTGECPFGISGNIESDM